MEGENIKVKDQSVNKEKLEVKKEKKELKIKWTGDFEHFNKDYGFICKIPNERLEIFIINDSGVYEWCEVDPTDSRIPDCIEKCSARLKFK